MINFGTYSAQPAAYACQEPHTAAHAIAGEGEIAAFIEAGQNALSLLIAEGVVSSGGCGIRTHEDASTP